MKAHKVSHTPGPWFVVNNPNGWTIQTKNGGVGQCIARSYADTTPENAALIAAAPDLYEALKMASESAGFQYMLYETRDAINAALATARGESC